MLQNQVTQIRKENYLLKESTKQSDQQTAKFQAIVQILKTKLKQKEKQCTHLLSQQRESGYDEEKHSETATHISGNTIATAASS